MATYKSVIHTGYQGFITAANKVEGAIIIVSVLLMGLNNVSNVIGRVAFNQSLFFTDELNSILIVFITFAGTSYAARQGSHIRMTAIFDMLAPKYQKPLIIFISFITSICVFTICYFSVEYISWIAPKGKVLPSMQIPVYVTYLWVPLSLFLTGVEYFATGVKNILSQEMHLSSMITGDGYDDINEL